jgi:hypothetical protein
MINTGQNEVDLAIADVKSRSLGSISNPISQLLVIASSRDYTTGEYYHDGLAFAFGEEIASAALYRLHCELFDYLVFLPIEVILDHLKKYILSAADSPQVTLRNWIVAKPYSVLHPNNCDPITANLFAMQIKLALELISEEVKSQQQDQ